MALIEKSNKFIFIHIFKCGGNSVREPLKQFDTYELHGVHCEARDVKKHFIGQGKLTAYNNAFKFVAVRNPFDWIVSTYFYIKRANAHELNNFCKNRTFHEFVNLFIDELMKRKFLYGQNKYLTMKEFITDDDGSIIVDSIINMEDFETDWSSVAKNLGINMDALPSLNVGIGRNREKDYRQYYNETSRARVQERFAEDLEFFGYEY